MDPWKNGAVRRQCYPRENNGVGRIIGIALIVLGILVLLFFVPGWAWLAIIAALFIACGILLIRK